MATSSQVENFIQMMVPIAQKQCKAHQNKIYVSVCIAQACHESGYGTSQKMRNANALYGIKVGKSAYCFGAAWKGGAYKTGTTEYYDGKNPTKITDWFRSYDSIEDATCDYLDMLCTASRYKGALNQPTAEKCIKGIIAGGYATGPNYVKHIMSIINTYHLTKYDPEANIEYFDTYEGNSDSIVEALEEIGCRSDKPYRKQIYDANFSGKYTYSAKQNTEMLVLLRQGKLIKP